MKKLKVCLKGCVRQGAKKPRKMSRKKKLLTAAAGLILFLAPYYCGSPAE